MTTPTPHQSNEEIIEYLRKKYIAKDFELTGAVLIYGNILEDFVLKSLQAKDSYWKEEQKRVVNSVPRSFCEGGTCERMTRNNWIKFHIEQLKNLNGIKNGNRN